MATSEKPRRNVIQLRRGNAIDWVIQNPVLADGEPGYEKDTRKHKVGDGVSSWISLPYSNGDTPHEDDTVALAALQVHIDSQTPHPVYDDGPSFYLLYLNARV